MNFYDADFILNQNLAGDLFSKEKEKRNYEYKTLVKIWHPDNCKNEKSEIVMKKINELYQGALKMQEEGKWEKTGQIQLDVSDNLMLSISYFSHKKFELGEIFICNHCVVYLFQNKMDYCLNAIKNIKNFSFADKEMEKEIFKFLPNQVLFYHLKKECCCLIIKKPMEMLSLYDIFLHCKQKINDRHVTWIISRLLNLACYFDYSGIVQNGISIENCFISPKEHHVFLCGGWWYTTRKKEKMLGVSKEIFDVMPILVKEKKCSHIMTDLESIKLLGRILLERQENIPKPLEQWLHAGTVSTALEEMQRWDHTIYKAYGKRKFINMNVTINEIYEKERKLWDAEAGQVKIGKNMQQKEVFINQKE